MTFSLVGRSADGTSWGVAVASKVRGRPATLGCSGDEPFDRTGRGNDEERHVPGSIDPVVPAALREVAA